MTEDTTQRGRRQWPLPKLADPKAVSVLGRVMRDPEAAVRVRLAAYEEMIDVERGPHGAKLVAQELGVG